MSRKRFDRSEAKALLDAGRSYADVADLVRVTLSTIYREFPKGRLDREPINKLKLDEEYVIGLLESGRDYRDVARELNVGASTLARRFPGYGFYRRSEKIDAEIKELFGGGATDKEIAHAVSLPIANVARRRVRMGLIRKTPSPRMSKEEVARAKSFLGEGYSIPQVAEMIGRSTVPLYERFPEHVLSRQEAGERAMLARWGERVLEAL